MQTEFIAKLRRIQAEKQSDLILRISPRIIAMPLPMKRHDDPFLPFGKAIITATRDLVCGYMFDLAAYLRIGAAGAIALERTISYVAGEVITILDGCFASTAYAEISDENAFMVDAVTLAHAPDAHAYLTRTDRAAFVTLHDNATAQAKNQPGEQIETAYMPQTGVLRVYDDLLRVVGDEALYAGHGEDYADETRRVLLEMKQDNNRP